MKFLVSIIWNSQFSMSIPFNRAILIHLFFFLLFFLKMKLKKSRVGNILRVVVLRQCTFLSYLMLIFYKNYTWDNHKKHKLITTRKMKNKKGEKHSKKVPDISGKMQNNAFQSNNKALLLLICNQILEWLSVKKKKKKKRKETCEKAKNQVKREEHADFFLKKILTQNSNSF